MRGGCAARADSDEGSASDQVGADQEGSAADQGGACAGTTLHADRRVAASTHSTGSIQGEKRGVLASDASDEGAGEREREQGVVPEEEEEARPSALQPETARRMAGWPVASPIADWRSCLSWLFTCTGSMIG